MQLRNNASLRRLSQIVMFACGMLLAFLACGLLASHARSFSVKRDTAVMIGVSLPELRSSVALFSANREAERFFSENGESAREEQAEVYVLPNAPSATRTVSVFQSIASALMKEGKVAGTVSTVTFEKNPVDHGTFKTLGVHLELTGDFRFLARFLSVLSYGGTMMIRDVLSDAAAADFLKQVNLSSPLSLKAAADFLYTDLIEYAAKPDAAEQELLKDIPIDVQSQLRSFMLSSGLASVRNSLSSIALSLRDAHSWPLPLLSVQNFRQDGKKWIVELRLYRR